MYSKMVCSISELYLLDANNTPILPTPSYPVVTIENVFRHCTYLLGEWEQNILLVEDHCFREIYDFSKYIQAEFLARGLSRTYNWYNREVFVGRSFEMFLTGLLISFAF